MTLHHATSEPGPHLPREGRPGPNTKTGRVWDIADALFEQEGRVPSRQDVIRRTIAEGGDGGTASVQFRRWRMAKAALDVDEQARRNPPRPRGERMGTWLPVATDGTMVLPAGVMEQMRLDPLREVLVEVVDGEVRLRSGPVALEHIQRLVRSFDTGTGSMVDELIADRRAEAAREADE